jgi:hypothetical protein
MHRTTKQYLEQQTIDTTIKTIDRTTKTIHRTKNNT